MAEPVCMCGQPMSEHDHLARCPTPAPWSPPAVRCICILHAIGCARDATADDLLCDQCRELWRQKRLLAHRHDDQAAHGA